jgi:hypothetical protein
MARKPKPRDKILRSLGITTTPGRTTLHSLKQLGESDDGKTPLMRYLEVKHGKLIDDLLYSGSLSEVAENLGIDHTTVSKWRKRRKHAV